MPVRWDKPFDKPRSQFGFSSGAYRSEGAPLVQTMWANARAVQQTAATAHRPASAPAAVVPATKPETFVEGVVAGAVSIVTNPRTWLLAGIVACVAASSSAPPSPGPVIRRRLHQRGDPGVSTWTEGIGTSKSDSDIPV